jgi:hypothetical protein
LARLRFELAVQLGAVAHQACQVAAAAQLADEARRMPGRTMRELQALQHDNVFHAALCQVVGDAAADDAATDDDDAGVGGQGHGAVVLVIVLRLPRHAMHTTWRVAKRAPRIELCSAAGVAPLRGSGEAASGVVHLFRHA